MMIGQEKCRKVVFEFQATQQIIIHLQSLCKIKGISAINRFNYHFDLIKVSQYCNLGKLFLG